MFSNNILDIDQQEWHQEFANSDEISILDIETYLDNEPISRHIYIVYVDQFCQF